MLRQVDAEAEPGHREEQTIATTAMAKLATSWAVSTRAGPTGVVRMRRRPFSRHPASVVGREVVAGDGQIEQDQDRVAEVEARQRHLHGLPKVGDEAEDDQQEQREADALPAPTRRGRITLGLDEPPRRGTSLGGDEVRWYAGPTWL